MSYFLYSLQKEQKLVPMLAPWGDTVYIEESEIQLALIFQYRFKEKKCL